MPRSSLRVAIVGAGPAGSAAATFLAERGAEVILLERRAFPRDKVCGDGCSPRCVTMLEQLGITDLPTTEAEPIRGFHLVSPAGRVLEGDFPREHYGGRALTVPRTVLDQRLVERAVAAGATLREREQVHAVRIGSDGVEVHSSGRPPLHADLVLGCDGSPSVVRRAVGGTSFPKRHACFAVRAYFEGVRPMRPHAFSIVFEASALPGYLWMFPLPGGRANIGLGMRADYLQRSPHKLKALFEQALRSDSIRPALQHARRTSPIVGHHLPLGSYARELVFDRTLLLGDAAGFINPISGEGIEFAMDSGLQAARTIEQAQQTGDFSRHGLRGYAERCEASFRRPFDLTHRLSSLIAYPRFIELMIRRGRRSPAMRALIQGAFSGALPRLDLSLVRALVLG